MIGSSCVSALLLLGIPTPGHAGDTGLFHLPTAWVLPGGRSSFSIFRDNRDRDPQDLDLSFHGFTLALGVSDRLEVFFQSVLQARIDADALDGPSLAPEAPFLREGWTTGRGDVRFGAKLQLLDDRAGDPVAFSVRTTFKLPTARRELGTGRPGATVQMVIGATVRPRLIAHAATGFELNADPDDVRLGNNVLLGTGLEWSATPRLGLQAEVTAAVTSGGDLPRSEPLDAVAGLVLTSARGLFARAALSHNLTFEGSFRSAAGIHATLGYHPGRAKPRQVPESNRPPRVSCHAERREVEIGQAVALAALAWDVDGDAIGYAWGATAGRIDSTAPAAALHTAGAAPADATVTVTATDARGLASVATCVVTLREPAATPVPPPPAAVARPAADEPSCAVAAFGRARLVLDNRAKACLDDVVTWLRRDPSTRVLLLGTAAPTERDPAARGLARARAVAAYLEAAGTAPERLTVASGGAGAAAAVDIRPLR